MKRLKTDRLVQDCAVRLDLNNLQGLSVHNNSYGQHLPICQYMAVLLHNTTWVQPQVGHRQAVNRFDLLNTIPLDVDRCVVLPFSKGVPPVLRHGPCSHCPGRRQDQECSSAHGVYIGSGILESCGTPLGTPTHMTLSQNVTLHPASRLSRSHDPALL